MKYDWHTDLTDSRVETAHGFNGFERKMGWILRVYLTDWMNY